ncbi:multiple epidermal growth factor-like domains protein 11 [Dreissena polymorpha]|uniref:multiple epidermal growth factor-like domains protein 11 n=1 Tax=Dreissena polymorpha TaxID=45954 RepID=UPI0022646A64|nr:multiple epidermal growth factor-like domains protein 11 [Dreissena polymorpha]
MNDTQLHTLYVFLPDCLPACMPATPPARQIAHPNDRPPARHPMFGVSVCPFSVHARVWTAFIYGLADKLAQISVKMCVIKRVVCAGVNPDSTQLRVTKTAGVNVLNVPTERHALCVGQQCTVCRSCFYGELCRLTCSTNCSSDGCDLITGTCLSCNTLGWYGPTCNETCSATCLNNVCDHNTGECKNACSIHCARIGEGQTCLRNGTCTNGCVQNYFGSTCETGTSFENKDGSPISVIAGSVGGVVVVLIVIGVAILILRKRTRRQPTDANEYYNMPPFGSGKHDTNPNKPQTDAESNYTTLGNNQEENHMYSSLNRSQT